MYSLDYIILKTRHVEDKQEAVSQNHLQQIPISKRHVLKKRGEKSTQDLTRDLRDASGASDNPSTVH